MIMLWRKRASFFSHEDAPDGVAGEGGAVALDVVGQAAETEGVGTVHLRPPNILERICDRKDYLFQQKRLPFLVEKVVFSCGEITTVSLGQRGRAGLRRRPRSP